MTKENEIVKTKAVIEDVLSSRTKEPEEPPIIGHVPIRLSQAGWNFLVEETCGNMGHVPLMQEGPGKMCAIGQGCAGWACLNVILPYREDAVQRGWKDVRDDCPASYGMLPAFMLAYEKSFPEDVRLLVEKWGKEKEAEYLKREDEQAKEIHEKTLHPDEKDMKYWLDKMGATTVSFAALRTTIKFCLIAEHSDLANNEVAIEAYSMKMCIDYLRREKKIFQDDAVGILNSFCEKMKVSPEALEKLINAVDKVLKGLILPQSEDDTMPAKKEVPRGMIG